MALTLLVFLIALINLILGFGSAVFAGRGPWSRYARRNPKSARSSSSRIETRSISQIMSDLENTEQLFQALGQQVGDDQVEVGQNVAPELLVAVRDAIGRFNAVEIEGVSRGDGEATMDLGALLTRLNTAEKDLEPAIAAPESLRAPELAAITDGLISGCREARGVFNALMFSPQPEVAS